MGCRRFGDLKEGPDRDCDDDEDGNDLYGFLKPIPESPHTDGTIA